MANRPDLLSEVGYGAFLVYSPRGVSDVAKQSRDVVYAVKQDKDGIIAQAVTYLREHLSDHDVALILDSQATLIPAPRSAPFPKDSRTALWPARRVGEELLNAGFGKEIVPCLERVTPIRKSAFAARGSRPSVDEHVGSMVASALAVASSRLVVVDDVVTKGATLLAAASWIQRIYPRASVACFALVRTRGFDEIDRIDDPCVGTISLRDGEVHRVP